MELYRGKFPIVNASNVFSVVVDLEIDLWKKIGPTISLADYKKRELTDGQRKEINKFCPQVEVMQLETPEGDPWKGFRTTGKPWAATFVRLPENFILLVSHYMHGADEIMLQLPAGLVEEYPVTAAEFANTAFEEVRQETGVVLDRVVPLSHGPIFSEPRNSTRNFMPFLGIVNENFVIENQNLDRYEKLVAVVMPLEEWIKVVDHGSNVALSASDTTYRALRYLGL